MWINWESFNHVYGPWYRIPNTKVVVQPDMDRRRWFWSVPEKGPYKAEWGHADTLAEAKAAAEAVWLKRK